MELILGSKAYEQTTHVVAPQEKPERGELQLPPRDQNDRRVFAYLTKTRKIDPEIVQDMMKQGRVYQSRQEINGKIRVNCAFIGYDERKYQDIVHFGGQVLTAVFDRTWKIRIRHMGLP